MGRTPEAQSSIAGLCCCPVPVSCTPSIQAVSAIFQLSGPLSPHHRACAHTALLSLQVALDFRASQRPGLGGLCLSPPAMGGGHHARCCLLTSLSLLGLQALGAYCPVSGFFSGPCLAGLVLF